MRVRLLSVFILLALSSATQAAIFTVTNNEASGAGSLFQAIEDANATPGRDVIEFAAGASTIPDYRHYRITDAVVIDGRTAPLYVPGGSPVIDIRVHPIVGLIVEAPNVELHALKFTSSTLGIGIGWRGSNGAIQGCHFASTGYGIRLEAGATGNTIGGTDPAARNVITVARLAAIEVEGAPGNVISGNFIGTDETGLTAGYARMGILIRESAGTIVRGNLIAGPGRGTGIDVEDSSDVSITGNTIGLGADGTILGNSVGIALRNATPNARIGGVTEAERNVISGNGIGIALLTGSAGAVIQGNYIGTAPHGLTPRPNSIGIDLAGTDLPHTIGGTAPGAGNLIVNNSVHGIRIVGNTDTAILANTIDANGALGIDAGAPGVTANDPGDADGIQNHPLLSLATGAFVSGTLQSVPSTSFRIEYFASPAADPSGFGEGRTFLGASTITTDVGGYATFAFAPPTYPADARYVSSTATRLSAELTPMGTSEFSNAIPVTPDIAIGGVTKAEGDAGTTPFVFPVTLSRAAALDASVSYAVVDATATTIDGDYVTATGTIVIPAGATTGTITIDVAGDETFELDESFVVTIRNPVNCTIAVAEGNGVIVNDDAMPAISIAGISELESGVFTLTLTLSNPSDHVVSTAVRTADASATQPADYAPIGNAVVSFAPGTTAQTITITVVDDALDESDETFVIALIDPVNATIADPQATATIVDDDGAPSIAIGDVSGSEGSGALTFTVTLSNASGLPLSVTAQTADGSAIAGSDYIATGPTILSFAPGVTEQTFTVPLIDDAVAEVTVTLVVDLTAPVGVTIADAQAVGSIEDDDAAPTLLIDAAPQLADESVVFIVTLSREAGFPVTVDFATEDETATAGMHYAETSGTLTFAPGTLTQTITIPLLTRPSGGGTRTFLLTLSNATGATLASTQVRAAIAAISATEAIPTLSEWMLLLLLTILGTAGAMILRR